MSARAATDAEMLAAVERWAKSRGFTRNRGSAWCVDAIAMQTGHRSGLLIQRRGSDSKYSEAWENVDPHTALLWACTVETTETLTSPPMPSEAEARAWAAARVMSGRMEIIRPSGVSARRPGEPREFVARVTRPLAVDVGRCPACVARSLPGRKLATTEWGIATAYGRTKPYIAHARYHPADGWLRGWGGKRRKGSRQWVQHHARPCPDCRGAGRDLREVARLVLDAAPTDDVEPSVGKGEEWLRWHGRREARRSARDRLSVAADQLQAAGERLGTWHALGLAGKDDAANEMVAWLSERTPVVNRYAG